MVLSAKTLLDSVDVAIVGAGTAGLSAYRAAAAATTRVALIERGPWGTMCARVGCMPSKLFVAAGDAAYQARRAELFGIGCSVHVDGRAVMDRVRRERDRFVDLVVTDMAHMPAEQRIQGRARIVEPGVIEVDGRTIRARAIVIATGSTPVIPSNFTSIGDRLVVNDDVFAWTTLPESVAVFGSGGIGLELGQALHRLGVRVRIFGRDGRIGPLTDPVVRAAAEAALRSEMALDSSAKVHEVRRDGDGVVVEFEDAIGRVCMETFAFALMATGRRPNFDGLGLENAGVVLGPEGVPLYDRTTLQCGSAPVFIAGDASGDIPILHEALDEGRIAGENAAAYPNVQSRPRRSRLQITFCDPQIAMVGSSFKELSRSGEPIVGEVSFEQQGRSRILGQDVGVGHLYADPVSGLFRGAEIAGPCAEHLGHLLAWAHQQELTIGQMLAMPFYHPVVEEGLRTALRDARTKLEAAVTGSRGTANTPLS
jgi:dihydrolipoamide dehydrogenase